VLAAQFARFGIATNDYARATVAPRAAIADN